MSFPRPYLWNSVLIEFEDANIGIAEKGFLKIFTLHLRITNQRDENKQTQDREMAFSI